MTWSLQNGRLDIAIPPRQLYHEGTLRPTELVEALDECIARCAVPSIHALTTLTEALQGWPRVVGSAA